MKDKKWTLYRHVSPSGKIYIGITSKYPVYKRWRYGTGYVNNTYFNNAIIKYGWDNIKHEILFTNLDEDRAKRLEIELIRHYKGLGISYNITNGGDGTLGRKFSKETIEKMRNSHKGKVITESWRKYMSEAQKRRDSYVISEKGKENIRNGIRNYYKNHSSPRRGITLSEEEKQKNRDSQKCKAVIQYDLNMNKIAEYQSIGLASKITGEHLSHISECCRGKVKRVKQYIWRFKDGI